MPKVDKYIGLYSCFYANSFARIPLALVSMRSPAQV
uniref:Uncharacterized protein n=1 Tax=Anguilla anguilla TaxID=7936 RepID=A0A0E9QZK0_ANGAN